MKKVFLILFFLTALTFINALRNPFMLDDYSFFSMYQKEPLWSFFVPNRNEVMGLDSANTERTYYRPLAHVIPMVCYRLFGANVTGYHAVNMFLMWLAGCCIFLFSRFLYLSHKKIEEPDAERKAMLFAFWTAVFFIVHPINGVLVNYITASVFAAQVILMLASLMCVLKSLTTGVSRSALIGLQVLSAVFFIFALMCHETAVMLPLFAVLILAFATPFKKEHFRSVLPLLIVLAVYFIFRAYASPFKKSILYSLSILNLTFPQKIATVLKLLSWYFSKLFFPQNIFLMGSSPFVVDGVWRVLALGFGIFAAGWILLARVFKNALLTVCVLWFLLGLMPIMAGAFVTPLMGGLIEPHWFVFAVVGFFAAVFLVLNTIVPKRFLSLACACLAAVLIIFSWSNNRLWSNEKRYYEAWLTQSPQFKAVHYFLALTYGRAHEFEKAYEHFNQSLIGRYKDWMVYLELGLIDLRRNDLKSADEHLSKAYALEKNHSGVLNAVGALAYKKGNLSKAKDFFEESIRRNPYNLEPRMNMAAYYKRISEPGNAARIYQEILVLEPKFMPAQKALGALQRMNDAQKSF